MAHRLNFSNSYGDIVCANGEANPIFTAKRSTQNGQAVAYDCNVPFGYIDLK